MALFPKSAIQEAILVIMLIKCGLCGLFANIYLTKTRKISELAALIFSCCYALSAYGIVYASNTMWIDCILNDHPKVAEFIKAGTQVAVTGTISLRVYSSQKDRCMKAGLTIKVRNIELLGGSTDAVPSRLYTNDGVQVDVKKFYNANVANAQLMSQRGQQFKTDEYGWVSEVKDETPATPAETKTPDPIAAAAKGEPSSKDTKGKKK